MTDTILTYELMSAPKGITLATIVEIYKKEKIVIYDSFNGGNIPQIFPEERVKDFKFVSDADEIQEILKKLTNENI